MAQVVLAEEELLVPLLAARYPPQLLQKQILQKKFLPQPQRHRHAKGRVAPRREGEIGLDQALELEERLVVEHHAIDSAHARAALGQAAADRIHRKPRVVLLAREALFLRRRDDFSVLDQRRRAVVIKSADAENAHR